MKRPLLLSLLTLALVGSGSNPLNAQEPTQTAAQSEPKKAPEGAKTQGGSESDWTFVLGVMGRNHPKYPGSNERGTIVDPFVVLDYKGIVGFQESRTLERTAGFYVRPFRSGPWSVGVLAMTEYMARNEKDAKALKGMGDRKTGLFGGLEFAYRTEPFSASLEVLKGANKAGLAASLNLGHTYRFSEQWGLEFGLTGVWGDKDYHAWEFGITPAQAARRQSLIDSGNLDLRPADARPFTPKAGIREVRAETMLQWSITERWMTFAMVQHGRLLNDAANGPLTRSKNQTSFGMGFGYQFADGHDGH